MEYIILLCFVLSFLVTLIAVPSWIKGAEKAGLVGKDIQKVNQPKVAEVGGICVILGFLVGVLAYIAIETFYFKNSERDLSIFAALSTILLITITGLVDDILGWKIGLRQWQKPVLALIAALPMVVVNAGHSDMVIPLIGRIDIGLLYPLLFVPIAISGASNGFNMLAGYNGLEAGMGGLILTALSFIAWKNNQGWVAVIALCMVFALLAFYYYNKYPAKVFPGDTLTYSVGAMIAIVAILGNMERVALIFFIPYFIELFLKLRGKFKKESFAKLGKDGYLEMPYDKFYGVEHAALFLIKKIRGKVTEKSVVYSIFGFELIFIIIGLIY